MLYRDFIKKKYSVKIKQSRLPSEYQEVEWIATDGNAYIDTGIIPDITSVYDCFIKFLAVSNLDQILLGCRQSSANDRFLPFAFNSNTLNIGYSDYVYGKTSFLLDTVIEAESHLKQGEQKWGLVGTPLNSKSNSFPEGFSFSVSLYLFRNHYRSTAAVKDGTRVYSLNVRKDGTDILNYVPCYRKLDNEIGMYDLIGQQFLTNQGTGTFTKGSKV